MKKIFFFFFIILIALSFNDVNEIAAQFPFDIESFIDLDVPTGSLASLSLRPSNQTPRPGENIEIKAIGSGFSEKDALYSWNVNGKMVASEKGEESIRVFASFAGEKITISLSIRASEGFILKDSLGLDVREVEILWQSLAYAPSWYKAKTLPAVGSMLALRASIIPEFKNSKDLKFTWTINGKEVRSTNDKGGAEVKVLATDILNIDLDIKDKNGGSLASVALMLPVVKQEILLYQYVEESQETLENNTFENLLLLKGLSLDLIGMPYFFNVKNPDDLSWTWTVDGKEIKTAPTEKNIIRLIGDKNSARGKLDLSVGVKNRLDLQQNAQKTIPITID